MLRFVTSLFAVFVMALPAHAVEVWVGAATTPEEISIAKRLLNSIDDLGTDPTNQQLATAMAELFVNEEHGVVNPDNPAFVFDATNIPANLCEATKCDSVGAVVCGKKPGIGSKGSTIFFDHCLTVCAPEPVKSNAPLFWVAIKCP